MRKVFLLTTYLIVSYSGDAVARHRSPLPIRSYPELRVHLVLRDDLAREDVAREEVVVHRLRDNLGNR